MIKNKIRVDEKWKSSALIDETISINERIFVAFWVLESAPLLIFDWYIDRKQPQFGGKIL